MSPQKAIAKQRRAELREIARRRKALATQAHRDLVALRRQADKLIKLHGEQDRILARRAAIVESRLG